MNRVARAAATAVLLAAAGDAGAAAGRLEVFFVDVGQGDAAFASTPSGRTLLVDAGPPEAADRLARFLRPRVAGPIDAVVLTHPHADHLGGMLAALRIAGARDFYDPVLGHPSPLLSALYRFLAPRTRSGEMVAHRVRAGETRPLDFGDGARLEFLAPREPLLTRERSPVNANSVVCRLTYGAIAVLFLGDAERGTERRLLRDQRAALRAAVMKVPHHGSAGATGAALLRAVAPRAAVVSVGAGNPYGHPHAATLARLTASGVRVLRTDVDGTVVVRTDGERLEIEALGPLR